MPEIANSYYLDFTSWHGLQDLSGTTVRDAYGLTSTDVTTKTVNVALILPRANDPTALLESNWATRQQTLAALNADDALWQTYGADPQEYDDLLSQLARLNIPVLGQDSGYVSSVESRTVWVSLDPTNFLKLFGTELREGKGPDLYDFLFWNGQLSLPASFGVTEAWVDHGNANGAALGAINISPYTPPANAQSIGNSAHYNGAGASLYPQQVADLYDFPLNGNSAVTGTIGLIEPVVGSALDPRTTKSFNELLARYLKEAGVIGAPSLYTVDDGGQRYSEGAAPERSLDVGVAASINPWSNIGFYAGSGTSNDSDGGIFATYQSAFWDQVYNPSVVSSSWNDFAWSSPNSPFYAAYQDLFVDAALRNITVFSAAGDGGSGDKFPSGFNNLQYANLSPYVMEVGGTSIALQQSAAGDPSMASLLANAQALDLPTIWMLMQSGLDQLPTTLAPSQSLLESVWNAFELRNNRIIVPPFTGDNATSGGVDVREAIPGYQSAYGLTPTNNDPQGGTGRGVPDVAALAGGDTFYIAPNGDMETDSHGWRGTSAAAPLWASFALQVDTIFEDQGLPQLGYANDLFYIASAIAPAAFNDINQGNNITTFFYGGSTYENDGDAVTPTGHGYYAGPGYDLATGLGSPNGLLLARALTAIGHSQMWFDSIPAVLDDDGAGGWTSGADQSLLFQTMSGSTISVDLSLGSSELDFTGTAAGTYAWTNQVAQQSLQADFDPNLVRLFDRYSQGSVMQSSVSSGASVGIWIDESFAAAIQGALSSPFGFADFVAADGVVRVARPVAVAETAGAQDDQIAVVRLRQNGTDNLSIGFYQVDDFSGKIGNVKPGDAAYSQAAQSHAYQFTTGGTSFGGPGYGNFAQTGLVNVDAGALIALKLTDNSTGAVYWGFAEANETVDGQKVGHLWNYGLNTWGFEDWFGGGDRDFNDLVVQLDFTSASGSGWLL